MSRLPRLLAPASIALLIASGCGSQPDNPTFTGKILPVKGIITYKGKPLTRGVVRFEPDAGREAEGEIKPDGSFTLTTFQEGDGAVPGSHRVAVVTPTKREIPRKYSSFGVSGIEIEVNEAKTEYAINLK